MRTHAQLTEVTVSDSPLFQKTRPNPREATADTNPQVRKSRTTHGVSHADPPSERRGGGSATNRRDIDRLLLAAQVAKITGDAPTTLAILIHGIGGPR